MHAARVAMVGVVLGLPARPVAADVDKALLKPAFSATPAELLATVSSAPAGDWPIGMIRQENQIRFDVQGRAVTRWRVVFVVRSQIGAEEWGTLAHHWQPFYQDKPVVRARVIEPGGKVTDLDQSLIHDAPAVEAAPSVFSDRRRLEAPLPRLQIGAVVEQEIVTTDRVPLLSAGTVDTYLVGGSLPIASSQIQFSAPKNRKAKIVARSLPAGFKPRHDVSGDRETWTYDLPLLNPVEEWQAFVPGDLIQSPYVGISTAASWGAVAKDYRKLLDQRISDGPFTLPSQLPRARTIETVRAITAWLHQQVRYTGIEFGDASTIPWSPAETVKRGFGDCKDKATLLVAMLRAVGIRADLALLSTGPGLDLDKDLPGMGVFDHAIVRAEVAGRDVWIDATEDLFPVGALPTRDQGRRALIIANDTRDLALTPRAESNDAIVRQIRTYELAEAGAARIKEVSREGGVFEASQRSWIRDTRSDEVRKDLVKYVETEYVSKSLASFVTTPPSALETPFEMTLVATDSSRAFTERDRIDVYLFAHDTFEKLPDLLTTVDDPVNRRLDFELPRPHTFEIENRLVLPPGFAPPSLKPEHVRKLGTMTLTERQRLEGQTIVVTYTLVTGKRRLTPVELRAVQTALQEVGKERTHIVIEHAGWALVERGKPRDAIAEVKKLIQLHPKEALHHTQLAFVLLRAGAGGAARAEAQLAVKLEPTNADAYSVLGWVLRHDTLGREYGFDHDRAGAIAALRKARKLDPKHVGAAADLATVLERDARGIGFDAGADLKGAAEAWRAAYDLEQTDERALSLSRALLRTAPAEGEKVLRRLPSGDVRDALLIATVAVARGGKAAIADVSTLRTGVGRTTVLDAAAGLLWALRQYDVSRELSAHTGTFKAGTPQAILMDRLKRQTTTPGPSKDPQSAVHNYFFASMSSLRSPKLFWDEMTRDELAVPKTNRQQFAQVRMMGSGFLWDLTVSSLVFRSVDGRPKGPWRVEYDAFGQRVVLFVALDKGQAKLIGEPSHPAGIGRHALRLLAARDEAGARSLLDWLKQELDASKLNDKQNNPFLRIWNASPSPGKELLELAAAVVTGGSDPASIPILDKCASKVADARKSCDVPLALAYVDAHRWQELERHATAWSERDPSAKYAIKARVLALARLGRLDDGDRLAEKGLAASPDDELLMHARVELAMARGQIDEAIKRLAEMNKRPAASTEAKNNLAWLQVSAGKDLTSTLTSVRDAVRDSKEAPHILNTLAAVLLELDDLSAARVEGWKSMELGDREQPNPSDWYVVGRLYEGLGLRDDAVAAYLRVDPEKTSSFVPTSRDLAQRRLTKLGVTSRPVR